MRKLAFQSVFLRCAALLVMSTLVVMAALSWEANTLVNKLASDAVRKTAQDTMDLGTRSLVQPLKFKVAAKIAETAELALTSAGDAGRAAMVFAADGSTLYNSGEAANTALETLAAEAQSSGGPVLSADGLSLAFPVQLAPDGPAIGVFAMEWSDEAALAATLDSRMRILLQALLVLAAMTGAVVWLLRRWLGTPLRQLTKAVNRVAEKDYDSPVPMQDNSGELGEIARSLAVLVDTLKEAQIAEANRAGDHEVQERVVEDLSVGLDAMSKGAFATGLDRDFPEQYELLRSNFNHAVSSVREALRSVSNSASTIRGGADEIAAASDDLSRRTEAQAATLEQTAAALDELSSSVRLAAGNADNADKAVRNARETAGKNEELMQSTIGAMAAIEASSDKIGEIISVIDDIAFQTNLLALNAGVEAARAGSSGKGFAVVASEVRALAQRSSDAARQIKDLISGSTEQVKSGAQLVDKAGQALEDMVHQVSEVSTLVADIATASNEQAQGLSEISTGMISLDQVTQKNAAMVEEATAAAHLLKSEVQNLSDRMRHFDLNDPTDKPQVAEKNEKAA